MECAILAPVGLLCISVAFIAGITYLITLAQSALSATGGHAPKNPPLYPYYIPFLGHAISFSVNLAGLAKEIRKAFDERIPVKLKVGRETAYLLSWPEQAAAVLKSSPVLTTRKSMMLLIESCFGAPRSVIPLYRNDNSGVGTRVPDGCSVAPENRIFHLRHTTASKNLSGKRLAVLVSRYASILDRELCANDNFAGDNWVDVPDLCDVVRGLVTRGIVEALFGPFLLETQPNFVEDLWAFNDALPFLLKSLPRWMTPKSYAARDKVVESIRRWHRLAGEHANPAELETTNDLFDRYWGSAYVIERQKYGKNMDLMNDQGLASEDATLALAGTGNVATSTTWYMLEVLYNSDLLARVRKEHDKTCEATGGRLSPQQLQSSPLLQSVYAETLRRHVGVLISRTAEQNVNVGGWGFEKDSIITVSSMSVHNNKHAYGRKAAEHAPPLDVFWADRFLQISNSGTQVFSMDNLAGSWIPYGGAQWMCPGRHFAKAIMITTFALFDLRYDVELRGPKPDHDLRTFGLGTLPPVGKVPARIRKTRVRSAPFYL